MTIQTPPARRDSPASHRETGTLLIEIVFVLLVISLLTAALAPPIRSMASDLRLRLAAAEVAGALYRARSEALLLGVPVGIRFVTAGQRVSYRLFRDGDGDGVRKRDVLAGIDLPIGPSRRIGHLGRDIAFGFPPEPPPFDPAGKPLTRLDDPIRFNRSDTASFSPLGVSTPGSVYLTDHRKGAVVIRLHGRTGKVRTLRWRPDEGVWR